MQNAIWLYTEALKNKEKHYVNYNHTLPPSWNHKKTGLKHKVRSIREEKNMFYLLSSILPLVFIAIKHRSQSRYLKDFETFMPS